MKKKIQVGRLNQRTKIDNRKALCGFDVRVGYATAAAAEISGDAAISCGLPSGSCALILSDGMGKGIKAAAGSRLVVSRLRKNLKEGMAVAKAIKEVNRYMIDHAAGADRGTGHNTPAGADRGTGHNTPAGAGRGTGHNTPAGAGHGTGPETFATVDLTIIDRKLCRAKFYKMGAATSFIVRGSRVRRIAGAALPVGIIPTLKLTHISAQLKAGDIIVMVSDGITDADRNDLEANWLSSYLSNYVEKNRINGSNTNIEKNNPATDNLSSVSPRTLAADILSSVSPRTLAADILREAQNKYGAGERDDLTVAVAIIIDNENKL